MIEGGTLGIKALPSTTPKPLNPVRIKHASELLV